MPVEATQPFVPWPPPAASTEPLLGVAAAHKASTVAAVVGAYERLAVRERSASHVMRAAEAPPAALAEFAAAVTLAAAVVVAVAVAVAVVFAAAAMRWAEELAEAEA